MSKIEVNTIEPQCGTTLTLGGSGDTVAIASGASALTLDVDINDGSTDYKSAKGVSIPSSSKVEILRGKYVLGTGYSLKATSSASGGDCDIVIGLLTDVS